MPRTRTRTPTITQADQELADDLIGAAQALAKAAKALRERAANVRRPYPGQYPIDHRSWGIVDLDHGHQAAYAALRTPQHTT